jgi:hypothetical protein
MNKSDISVFPEIALVRQQLHQAALADITRTTAKAVEDVLDSRTVLPGQRVAVALGSRGIDGLATVCAGCLNVLRQRGLEPFIVPAMGSHGGATAEGQRQVLEKFGISQSTMGVPVVPDMDTVCVGNLGSGVKIHFSQKALEADHIVVINRVKRHTKFRADIESGLCKMLTIGLGKAKGAEEIHRRAVALSFGIIEEVAAVILNKCNILFGLALLEDGCGNLAQIESVPAESMIATEKILLQSATDMMGRIPFDNIDILVVDQFGKDISGIGMDPNVTGRHRDIVGDYCIAPHIKRIFVRDFTPSSDGNGNGIGLADVTTARLVKKLDMEKTYKNAITAISPEKAAVPIHFDTDSKALVVCAGTAGLESPATARLVRIKDTKSLEVMQVSSAFAKEIEGDSRLEQLTPWVPMAFDIDGNLMPMKEGDA